MAEDEDSTDAEETKKSTRSRRRRRTARSSVVEAQYAEAVEDPVDEDAYPERPYAEASEGVLQVKYHEEDDDSLQLEQDPETGALRRIEGDEGPLVNPNYRETVVVIDDQVVGYVPPVYEDAEA